MAKAGGGGLTKARCAWAGAEKICQDYHDREWGRPVRDDRLLFEFLSLECLQAGLSWLTVLKKRGGLRRAFSGFDPAAVALYDENDVGRLLADPDVIRNRLKILGIVANAKACLAVQADCGSFSSYVWGFVGGAQIKNHWQCASDLPARTEISDRMSKGLKKRGFKFTGPVVCYAFMQAVGMVNDHTAGCFLYREDLGGAP
jgi:DNA-3-methyladenine glycosylase I